VGNLKKLSDKTNKKVNIRVWVSYEKKLLKKTNHEKTRDTIRIYKIERRFKNHHLS